MTGKEALIHVSKCCSALAFEEGKWRISEKDNEALQTLMKIVKNYDKYKRAFEILNEKLYIQIMKDIEEYYLIGNFYYDKINKAEYELLKELMSNEN